MSAEDASFRPSRAVARVEAASRRPLLRPATGGDVSLAIGEPDFATPPAIVNAAAAAVAGGYTHYAHADGDPELREALAAKVSAISGGAAYGSDQVIVTHGGTGGLAAAILATIDPGDRVVIPEPTYSLYADLVIMAGGEPVLVGCLPDQRPDLDAIGAALRGARMLVLCNPGNPTGIVLTGTELDTIAGMLEPETLVISDEAYDRMIYGGRRFVSALTVPALRERLIYVQTFSKTYAMTGWRVGYVATTERIARAVSRINRTLTGPANAATQRAALAALAMTPFELAPMLDEYARRREFVVERLGDIEGITLTPPEGAFYAFIGYDAPLPAAEVAARMLEGGVIVRAGTEFGPSGEGHLRLSFATSMEKLDIGLSRLDTVLRGLRVAGPDRSR